MSSDRFTNSHRKAGSPRLTTYETQTVAKCDLDLTFDQSINLNVNLPVVKVVPSAPRPSQKRDLSPGLTGCYSQRKQINT